MTLERQDRTLEFGEIERADVAETALRRGGAGFYALQAAIAALHAQAARAEDTDWRQIAALYALLLQQHPSPVVALNHAAAVAMGTGLEQGLRLIEALEATGELDGYHLLPLRRRRGVGGADRRSAQRTTASAGCHPRARYLTGVCACCEVGQVSCSRCRHARQGRRAATYRSVSTGSGSQMPCVGHSK